MYLLDTNVVSALAPTGAGQADLVADWLRKFEPSLYLSVVTATEIQSGIDKAKRTGAVAKALRLETWWGKLEWAYGARILPLDLATAKLIGSLNDMARAHDPGFADMAIAATAQVHGLTVLTRNMRHFRPLGVSALDPFEQLPL